ncbi:MAG: tetratricopeptide repeat protein [Rickettsiaceae bacterium]|nr:tetratricopeptide repeat protein [Rickettsiaceae bacterium]
MYFAKKFINKSFFGRSCPILSYHKKSEDEEKRIISQLQKDYERLDLWQKLYDLYQKNPAYPLIPDDLQKCAGRQGDLDNRKIAEDYFYAATSYLKMGEHHQSSLYLEKTLELNKHHYNALHNLSIIYKYLGRFDDAASNCQKLVALNPTSQIKFSLSNNSIATCDRVHILHAIILNDAEKKEAALSSLCDYSCIVQNNSPKEGDVIIGFCTSFDYEPCDSI